MSTMPVGPSEAATLHAPGQPFAVAIPSSGRADQVPAAYLFPRYALIVPPAEHDAYLAAHPTSLVIPQEGVGVAAARNTALDAFPGSDLLMLDDDVAEIGMFQGGKLVPRAGRDLVNLVIGLFTEARRRHLPYFGVAPTTNAFFSRGSATSTNLFVNGSCTGYLAGILPRFDPRFRLKEDYDYTLQCWRRYGGALRFNRVYAKARHRDNPGGACAYRTAALEDEMIALLKAKWGSLVRDNPRRPHEVLLALPKAQEARR